MPRMQAAHTVLNPVQVFNQQIAATRRVAKQGKQLLARGRVHAPPLRCGPHAAAVSRGFFFTAESGAGGKVGSLMPLFELTAMLPS